ncbi:MAG: hypothetical protein WDN00_05785 [Limisphaerales bacterium]
MKFGGWFAAFAGNKPSVIPVKELCWTAIYVQNSFQNMKLIGHKSLACLNVRPLDTDEAIATFLFRHEHIFISVWRMQQAARTTKQGNAADVAAGRDFFQSVRYYREI